MQTRMSFFFSAVFFLALQTFADAELIFPLEKNNVQILPLRFEYQLVDKNNFQLGDVLLNADQFKFELVKLNTKSKNYKAVFQFPSSIIESGEIAIKDPGGKAIFTQNFKAKEIKLKKSEDKNLRNSTGMMELPVNVSELVQKLRFFAFFRLCLHREEQYTKVYLCSKELYVKNIKGDLSVQSRDSLRPESYVEINGKIVGNQGVIFLNDPNETLSLRTLLLSGASFEIETKLKKVDFSDVTLSEDGSKLIVRAEGAPPVNEDSVKRLSPTSWSTELSPERPFLYLRAEGDIPMRQEFLINGKVRDEKLRVQVIGQAPATTYSSSLSLLLRPSQNAQILPADKKSEVQKRGDTDFFWQLNALDSRRTNRRFVSVQTDAGKFIAAYDITRLPSQEIHLLTGYPVWGELLARKTLGEKWNLFLNYQTLLAKSKNEFTLNAASVGVGYKIAGFRSEIGYTQLSESDQKLTGTLLMLSYDRPLQTSALGIFDEYEIQLNTPISISNADVKMTGSYEIGMSLYSELTSDLGIETKLAYRNWKFAVDSDYSAYSRAILNLGLRWQF